MGMWSFFIFCRIWSKQKKVVKKMSFFINFFCFCLTFLHALFLKLFHHTYKQILNLQIYNTNMHTHALNRLGDSHSFTHPIHSQDFLCNFINFKKYVQKVMYVYHTYFSLFDNLSKRIESDSSQKQSKSLNNRISIHIWFPSANEQLPLTLCFVSK